MTILARLTLLTATLCATATAEFPQSDDPPVIPVGQDAYLMWDRLCYHRIGVRAYMRSTYDREGNNRSADASHFLYQEAEDFNTTLDVRGSGILYFKRTNHWHGSPWHYEVDGRDFIVRETATADPVNAKRTLETTTFIPQDLFPNPLTWTWSTTKGADLMWVPLPFENTLRIAYSRTFYGTGYYIYHLFSPGMSHLSRPIQSWDRTPPDPRVLDLLRRAGTDIAPVGTGVTTRTGRISLAPHQNLTLAELHEAPATIRALKFTVPRNNAYDFGKCRLRITWDRRWHSSIDVPVDLFFGTGHLYNNDDREYLVRGLPMVVRYAKDQVHLSCFYPMPFFKHAEIELCEERGLPIENVQWEIRTVPFTEPINHAAYFHATYSDHREPKLGQDLVFLDTDRAEGGGPWSGHFAGMSWIFSRRGYLGTLEGDPRFFLDDSRTPQGWGTGTEEWGGGGDYWGGRNMTLPLAGHPVGANKPAARDERDLLNSAYRFLIADLFPFGRRAVIGLEHGGENQTTEHYSGVVYWYGMDSPSLVLTDHFHTCDAADIKAHHYVSPTAGEPYSLASRYEWGSDHHGSQIHFYPEEDTSRIMTGTSEFTMRLDPRNLGVLLRRKLDYQYPNQCAKVSAKPAGDGADWQEVGLWYTAGSNTCVYSYPRSEGELGKAQHRVITGNRRWREEEFLIPRHLTEGVEQLAIRIEHVPDHRPLFPGHPFPVESAWSEARYWAYCYRMPTVRLTSPEADLAREFLPFRFLREAREYTTDQPVQPWRDTYNDLIDDPEIDPGIKRQMTAWMASIEKKSGHDAMARSLIQPLVEPFIYSDVVDNVRDILGQKNLDAQPIRPLLVDSGDGSVKCIERAGAACIITQRQRRRPFVYFKFPKHAGLPTSDHTLRIRITCYCDGTPGQALLVEYDATDDAYRDAEKALLPEEAGWHKIVVECPEARLDGRQNSGADFRIASAGNGDAIIAAIEIVP